MAVLDGVSDLEYAEPVPAGPHEYVCEDCHLIAPRGHGFCTNCELWPPTTNPRVIGASHA